jgi:hypothetical protein
VLGDILDINMLCKNTAAGQHKVSKAGQTAGLPAVQCATFLGGQRGITWALKACSEI